MLGVKQQILKEMAKIEGNIEYYETELNSHQKEVDYCTERLNETRRELEIIQKLLKQLEVIENENNLL